jgi:hypothetical protein
MLICIYDKFTRLDIDDVNFDLEKTIDEIYYERMAKLKKLLNAGVCTKIQYKLIKDIMLRKDIEEILINNRLDADSFREQIFSLAAATENFNFKNNCIKQ